MTMLKVVKREVPPRITYICSDLVGLEAVKVSKKSEHTCKQNKFAKKIP